MTYSKNTTSKKKTDYFEKWGIIRIAKKEEKNIDLIFLLKILDS